MGNGIGKVTGCFTGGEQFRRKKDAAQIYISDPLDEGLGHSFCYIRPDPYENSSSKVYSDETTTFRSISGASVSANASTPLSTSFVDLYSYNCIDRASSAFESSTSFCSIPLQPVPKILTKSGSGSGGFNGFFPGSGLVERGFLSGPIERGFMSGPIEKQDPLFCSGPLQEKTGSSVFQFRRSFSHSGFGLGLRSRKGSLMGGLRRAISKKMFRSHQNSVVAPVKKEPDWIIGGECVTANNSSLNTMSSECSLDYDDSLETQNLQWAQGKAGEDRVHVVVSDEFEWVFVGIYDGFNGPDAPDYLMSNLYVAVHKELKGLLWDDDDNKYETTPTFDQDSFDHDGLDFASVRIVKCCNQSLDQENYPCDVNFDSRSRKTGRSKYNCGAAKKWEENQRRWKCEWDRERLELDKRLKEELNSTRSNSKSTNHSDVLKALSRALRKTEEAYLNIADMMVMENPELALMGSCVLVMLMKGENVYVLNVGDSRAVLAQKAEPDFLIGKVRHDLERISEETLHDLVETCDGDRSSVVSELTACQLTVDHSTNMEEEVRRIKREHQDDACAVMNDRVKGSLKVTRAFGAGFLKQPKWNDALLEMFRIDYIGTSPYITCFPSLHHHRLGSKDRFLILSSDGLYQYFTNQEAVAEVELFISMQPEGDPAQHLIEELLFRAAKKAGLDFHALLEIPQGDRRRYHDDVSIIVISLEGRIWRSCV